MFVDTYRGIDNYVCWCHNSPLYVLYGKAKTLRHECYIEMGMDEVKLLAHDRSVRDKKWYVSEDGHLLENQAVWAPDSRPPHGFSQRQSAVDLTFFVHMYVRTLGARMHGPIGHGPGEAEYIDEVKRSIWLKRSLIQPYGADAEGRRVNEPHRFPEVKTKGRKRELYHYVKTWTGYMPLMVEVIKAEYDWLACQADQDYNDALVSVTGVNPGVIIHE
jgi:hypothetical protein